VVRSLLIYSRNDEKRHEENNILSYPQEDRYEFPLDPDEPLRSVKMPEKQEFAGVLRMVHGWIQQRQKSKVRFKHSLQFTT